MNDKIEMQLREKNIHQSKGSAENLSKKEGNYLRNFVFDLHGLRLNPIPQP